MAMRMTVYVGPTMTDIIATGIGLLVPDATDIIAGTEHVIFTYPTPANGWGGLQIMDDVAEQTGWTFLRDLGSVTARRLA